MKGKGGSKNQQTVAFSRVEDTMCVIFSWNTCFYPLQCPRLQRRLHFSLYLVVTKHVRLRFILQIFLLFSPLHTQFFFSPKKKKKASHCTDSIGRKNPHLHPFAFISFAAYSTLSLPVSPSKLFLTLLADFVPRSSGPDDKMQSSSPSSAKK